MAGDTEAAVKYNDLHKHEFSEFPCCSKKTHNLEYIPSLNQGQKQTE